MFTATAQSLTAEFLTTEFPDVRLPRRSPVNLAAVGTIASRALTSSLLTDQLTRAEISVAHRQSLTAVDELFGHDFWQLALVLSPFKRTVAAWCTDLTPAARQTGVVDTLVRLGEDVLGVNTNAYAAGAALLRLCGNNRPESILIAGAGASARSVIVGAQRHWPDVILGIMGRSANRVAELTREVGAVAVDNAELFSSDVVVNATTVGETDDEVMSFDLTSALRPGVRYFDLNNRFSSLQRNAVEHGCCTMGGRLMQMMTNALRTALLAGWNG